MVSEHDSATLASSVFKAIVFAPLVVVGVLILLASWMAILEAWSWLLYKFHQYRARRAIDGAAARNMDSGMAENGMPENGPSPSERAGSNTEELLKPTTAFTEERVWWAMYQ